MHHNRSSSAWRYRNGTLHTDKKYSDEQEIGGKQQLTDERIHLTKEDRKQFAEGIKTVNAIQFLIIKDIIAECEDRLTAQDLKFIHSHLGQRA